jgi:hypothetical protein
MDDHQTHLPTYLPTYLPTSLNWKFKIIKFIKKNQLLVLSHCEELPFFSFDNCFENGQKKTKPGVEILDQGISDQHKRQWMD